MRVFPWLVAVAVTAVPAALAAQSGAYRTLQNGRELTVEVYRWTGDTLDATADVPLAGHRVVARTVYDAAFEPLSYDLRVYSLATGAQQQAVQVTFGDSARFTVNGRAAPLVRALPAPRAVMQNLLWSHIAAMARRLPPSGDASLVLHTLLVDNGSVLDLTLARQAGRVTASLAGTVVVLAPTGDGGLDSASVPSQGLRIERVPADSVSASRPLAVRAPTPLPPDVREEPYGFTDGAQQLSGTLARPAAVAGPVPVVIILAGSGPTDRDGNSRLGLTTDLYKKLAWDLAEQGIATLRYDKRGIGASPLAGTWDSVTFDDFARDAIAAARGLASDRRFSRVVMLGHSEGASLATRAANLGAPVAGVVMLAGMGRPLTTVLREQVGPQLDSAQNAVFERTMAAYLASGPMPDVPADLRALFNPSARKFLQTESATDPAEEARRVRVPLLVIQGGMDIQVSVADAEALRAAHRGAEVHILPDANHLFVHVATRERAAQLVTYNDPSLPLVPELVPLVTAFVQKVAP
ncbi:MAG TPA: alpha/beta hydrolase [Gemmatimonadales bacterium]|nr:alpha/beta hydrolase [Gemmatimonadales bacterium]